MMPVFILVGFAGALGAVLRYSLSFLFTSSNESLFPLSTLTANLIGCFILALFTAFYMGKRQLSEKLQTAIATGLIGSFTTFSTFSVETVILIENRAVFLAFAYILISGVGGFALAILGFHLGKRLSVEGGRQ